MTKRALILVDIQNDFLPGGSLAVPGGDEIVSLVNRIIERFDVVVATQDWHPKDHESFALRHPGKRAGDTIELHGLQQRLWPEHCVQDTQGAEFPKELESKAIDQVFQKGTRKQVDSYSGFFDNGKRHATGMAEYLKEQGITDVYIAGLATDYCVKATTIDACELGFRTHLLLDACRGVGLTPDCVPDAIDAMVDAGALISNSTKV